ncbi:DNA internalization-related competence protein ComEC/Rec2 [Weissella ceti]|uniref:DNA internalization-related competence protein ComEC/Rec2 n=1 Tax=Weissella ceti TaxID=759620 RepID=A0ABT3E2Z0_9LACO|nr:DNA internalization-related competence protein ComEC/Rec2 [Weissella ceti]MCW0952784.1 DNA internalization-related competence protein ComEC/Rec2 [Weissella ceti]
MTWWQYREYQLAQQITKQGTYNTTLTLHRDDFKWQAGYLTGTAKLSSGEMVKIKGKTAMPPDEMTMELSAEISCTAIESNRNRFNFNPQQYWHTKGIVLEVLLVRNVIWQLNNDGALEAYVKSIHYNCVQWFERLPAGLRDYGQTLLLGYTRSEFYEDNKGIQRLGLVHLFSISGFQVTLCFNIWFTLARYFRLYREDAQIGWFGGLLFIWLFAGGVQSLIRAILASGVSTYNQLTHKLISGVDVWGIVLIGSLIIEPGVLHQLGGQLSFLLSFGLLWLHKVSFWQVNLILNLLIAPLLLVHTYAWQPIGVLVNFFVIPIFAFIVVPIVFVGVLASILHWQMIRDCCESVVCFVQYGIKLGDAIPGEIMSGQPVLWWVIITIGCTAYMLVKHNWQAYGLVGACYGFLICGVGAPNQTFVAFIDAKQGDATIWRTKAQEVYMMDVGGQFDRPNDRHKRKPNVVANQLCTVLKGYGIRKIDHLILSHQDIDHIGNFASLVEKCHVQNVYVPAGMKATKNFKTLIQPFLTTNTSVHEVLAGQKIGRASVIHPFKMGMGKNEDSISIVHEVLGKRFLLTGDLDVAGEETMLKQFNLGRIDVLKCGHHGSKTSTSDALLDRILPEVSIVSSGKDNRFKHPHEEVLAKLRRHMIPLLNTAEVGMIYYEDQRWQTMLRKT